MMKRFFVATGLIVSIFIFSMSIARAGGWAVLTLQSWPGEVTAGQPFTIEYALRQHGSQLVPYDASWMDPTITTVHTETGTTVEFKVVPTEQAGYYQTEMVLPQPGSWRWSIDAFGKFEMPPLTARAETAEATSTTVSDLQFTADIPLTISYLLFIIGGSGLLAGLYFWFGRKARFAPVLSLLGVGLCLFGLWLFPTNQVETAVAETAVAPSAEMGQILFVSKGCVTCHLHEAVSYSGIQTNIGPNLTSHDVSADFLRLWLRDPSQIRPQTVMPDLELTDDEIESLIAFIQIGDDK